MSERLDRAIIFATNAHSGQTRKRENTPYILHPLEVAAIAADLTNDEDVIIAALLHDTVEDTDVTLEEITEVFGSRVAELVGSESENKREELPPEVTWQLRKEESLNKLRNTDDEDVKILWLSDKLSNIRSIYSVYLKKGDEVWDKFNMKDISKQKWYYTTISELLVDYKDTLAYQEYYRLVKYIFREH